MGLQKYRADEGGEHDKNGARPFFTKWMGGPTLALIRNCKTPFGSRTVYVTGEANTFFSIPAAIEFRRKRISGYVCLDNDGNYEFRPYTGIGTVYPFAS